MAEIIVVDDPIYEQTSEPIHRENTAVPITRSITFGDDHEHVYEPFDSERLPASLASEIQRFLRVANLIECDEPRIAYLCRFPAFEVAHNLDRNSAGRGVRQFKTFLLQRLEQDEETSIRRRKEESDILELRRVYNAYNDYIIRHGGAFDLENRHTEKLANARRIASVLHEVLKNNDSNNCDWSSGPC